MNKYFIKNKKNIFLYILAGIITIAVMLIINNMYGMITDVVKTSNYSKAREVVLLCIIVFILFFVLLFFVAYLNRIILNNITMSLRNDLFNKVYALNYSNFVHKDVKYYISMINNDVQLLEENYFAKILEFFLDFTQLFLTLIAIAIIGWRYFFLVCVLLVFIIVQPFILKNKLSVAGVDVSNKIEEYTGKARELINGFETIKGLGNSRIFVNKFKRNIVELENTNVKLWHVKALNSLLAMLTVNILRVGGQLFFVNNAINGLIDATTVAILLGYINSLGNPAACILGYIEPINSTKDIRNKINSFLKKEVDKKEGEKCANEIFSDIVLENVSFSYDNKNILDNLNMKIERGKKYALIGESGCGKSTILKLLMKYYDNYTGNIFYNKKDIRNLNPKDYKKNISYVTQNAYIFSDTIKNNITLGNNVYKEEKVNEIIDKVQLKELSRKIKNGKYDIKDFSGGEKQRIALARALINDSDLILVDEGTSALDNITASMIERIILENQDKTVVSIVHRFNDTIKLYDVIYYIENGQVVEKGSYDELMYTKGKTFRMLAGKEGITNEKDN